MVHHADENDYIILRKFLTDFWKQSTHFRFSEYWIRVVSANNFCDFVSSLFLRVVCLFTLIVI